MNKIIFYFNALLVCISLASCLGTKNASYFYSAKDTLLYESAPIMSTPIQKNDILSINITSLNAEASSLFNGPNASNNTTSFNGAVGYLVNSEGNIQLPILGTIKAEGLTNKNLRDTITQFINDKKLLLDPIVSIRQLNYDVTIIGEVGKPTVINVLNERISLLKALGMAGDITVFGKKNNVLLVREINGQREVKRINLNAKEFLSSPYYYLQANDVVYVEPNKQKIKAANRNQQLLPAILSAISIVAIVITNVYRKN